MTCLEENELIDLAHGQLDAEALAIAEAHLDGCDDCRFLLAELLEPDRVRAPSWDLPRGERVGRYVILDRVGVGGMGTVYAAYDATLGRKVALKLLHARPLHDPEDSKRLLREAQAMARLHHGNILAVHDVGAYGGHVYLAMDLVDGKSLRECLYAQPATLAEILDAFHAAGAGLYAAHRAGIVHCDFKPDNVLRSTDGRIRVTDFGLARPCSSLEIDGAAGGSLPYMAPEQLRKEAVTEASDQWSFCVAFYEAVYGERPFHGRTATEFLAEIERGALKPPAYRPGLGDAVPAWLAALLVRGLSPRPRDRFSSMGALVDALSQRPAQRARRIAASVVIALVAICGIAALRYLELRPLRQCQAAATAQWRRDSSSPPEEWTRLARYAQLMRALAAYRDRWHAEALRSCADTFEFHSQTIATQQLRLRCARRQAFDIEAVRDLLLESPRDAQSAAHLVRFVEDLPGPERCSTARVISAAQQSTAPSCTSEPCDRTRALLASARVQRAILSHVSAQALLSDASKRIESTNDPSLRAELRLEEGLLEFAQNEHSDHGLQSIKEALWLAQRARDDELTAIVWARLLTVLSSSARPELVEETQRLLPHAQAALTRIGGDAELGARLPSIKK